MKEAELRNMKMRESELRELLSNNLGKQLCKARNYWGLSRIDLARSIGITQPYISNIENGNQLPSLTILFSFCAIMKVKMDFFMSNDDIEQYIVEREQFKSVASNNRDVYKDAIEIGENKVYLKAISKFESIVSECNKAMQGAANKLVLNTAVAEAEVVIELLKELSEYKPTFYADTYSKAIERLKKEVAYETRNGIIDKSIKPIPSTYFPWLKKKFSKHDM